MSDSTQVVTRFAPSPTGFLHIGGARTALFNWLYAKRHNGKFLLRIEDTDRKRSTDEAVEALLDGLTWLGLDWDGEPISQFARAARHVEVAKQLIDEGKAYYCYLSPEELTELREKARAEGTVVQSPWRDRDPSEAPEGVDPVIRLRSPLDGETVINDQVQGDVKIQNTQLDDMIMVRADGTPTYMLAVVVDDHDMGVTHIIRGDDHLVNAARQILLFQAMGWDVPSFSHIPLIHGPDGKKLSKRHGALGAEAYRDMGYLPEAMRNYLLRLGWSHGDDEVISTAQAIEWFNLEGINKAAARFDFEKLENLNALYIKEADDAALAALIMPALQEKKAAEISDEQKQRIVNGIVDLKPRAKTLNDLSEGAFFYVAERPLALNDKAAKLINDEAKTVLSHLYQRLAALPEWTGDVIKEAINAYAAEQELKLKNVFQPLRAALTGSNVSPGVIEVLVVLGQRESLDRISDISK